GTYYNSDGSLIRPDSPNEDDQTGAPIILTEGVSVSPDGRITQSVTTQQNNGAEKYYLGTDDVLTSHTENWSVATLDCNDTYNDANIFGSATKRINHGNFLNPEADFDNSLRAGTQDYDAHGSVDPTTMKATSTAPVQKFTNWATDGLALNPT